jgi:hypothetical protein
MFVDFEHSNSRIRVAVVPEHFSIPFHIGVSDGVFERHSLQVEVVREHRFRFQIVLERSVV